MIFHSGKTSELSRKSINNNTSDRRALCKYYIANARGEKGKARPVACCCSNVDSNQKKKKKLYIGLPYTDDNVGFRVFVVSSVQQKAAVIKKK